MASVAIATAASVASLPAAVMSALTTSTVAGSLAAASIVDIMAKSATFKTLIDKIEKSNLEETEKATYLTKISTYLKDSFLGKNNTVPDEIKKALQTSDVREGTLEGLGNTLKKKGAKFNKDGNDQTHIKIADILAIISIPGTKVFNSSLGIEKIEAYRIFAAYDAVKSVIDGKGLNDLKTGSPGWFSESADGAQVTFKDNTIVNIENNPTYKGTLRKLQDEGELLTDIRNITSGLSADQRQVLGNQLSNSAIHPELRSSNISIDETAAGDETFHDANDGTAPPVSEPMDTSSAETESNGNNTASTTGTTAGTAGTIAAGVAGLGAAYAMSRNNGGRAAPTPASRRAALTTAFSGVTPTATGSGLTPTSTGLPTVTGGAGPTSAATGRAIRAVTPKVAGFPQDKGLNVISGFVIWPMNKTEYIFTQKTVDISYNDIKDYVEIDEVGSYIPQHLKHHLVYKNKIDPYDQKQKKMTDNFEIDGDIFQCEVKIVGNLGNCIHDENKYWAKLLLV